MAFNKLMRIFRTKNERELRRLIPLVRMINELEPEISKLSDKELCSRTNRLREGIRATGGESESQIQELREMIGSSTIPQEKEKLRQRLKQIKNKVFEPYLVEAFAVVREAAKRQAAMRHFDVQLMGAIVLHQGKISEMATGEGKTLVATMPLYLNALTGEGAHLITVNDYLAKRDRNWMGPIYESLGLSVGVIQHDMDARSRQEAYSADITYGTNNEFGFDYLRDNMVIRKEHLVQRGHHYAIVDEVDSILIDEARTPLIISGPSEESTDKYHKIETIARKLEKHIDYEIDEKAHTVSLTDRGVEDAERLLGIDNLSRPEMMEDVHHVNQALRAKELFHRDTDYMLKDGNVVIVDEFTGRLMPGRRWSDGLHQAIEAKEGVRIERENQTLATITFQNYFRLYEKLAGMTGTANTEASEFHEIYMLEVLVIPTNKPLLRTEHPDVIYKTAQEKFEAVVGEIEEMHRAGRPVLVGTISIEKSERLSNMLRRKNVPHHVLNARYHEKEAEIVAQAGQMGAVTIATNMAGRGTDIVLGEGVPDKEGLHIVGTERHEARRIDNQLRGRAGRQGDPGSSRFYLSLEDDLMRIFASERIAAMMDRFHWEKGVPLEHRLLTRVIEGAQKRVEGHNFDIRKQLLEFDNVMNRQREVIYEQRRMVLEREALKDSILGMIDDIVKEKVSLHAGEEHHPEDWNLDELGLSIKRNFGVEIEMEQMNLQEAASHDMEEKIKKALRNIYDERESKLGSDAMRSLEQAVMLQVIDSKWKDHLLNMDYMREGVHERSYGKDPLVQYSSEAFELFQEMISSIKESISEYIFKLEISPEAGIIPYAVFHPSEERFRTIAPFGRQPEPALAGARESRGAAASESRGEMKVATYRREGKKVGRNEPCPCGSGRKHKKCCGS